MTDVLDTENKERLIEEIYKAVKYALPENTNIPPKSELQIELLEKMLDNALGINSSNNKRFYDYGLTIINH
jgi:hypothetical protein|tara:strand:+ start:82 stop:294 length:213 start_codon:yes stop_codon:yes gene_type:complete